MNTPYTSSRSEAAPGPAAKAPVVLVASGDHFNFLDGTLAVWGADDEWYCNNFRSNGSGPSHVGPTFATARAAATAVGARLPPRVGDRWGDLEPAQWGAVPVGSELGPYGDGKFSGTLATKNAEGLWNVPGVGVFSSASVVRDRRITRLGPAPTTEPDRSGWPVLVYAGNGWYRWHDGEAAVQPSGEAVGTFRAWKSGAGCHDGNFYPTAREAAEALCARLPDDVSDAGQLAAGPLPEPDEAEAAKIEHGAAMDAIAAIVRLGHTEHCAKRLAWGDGECECKPTNARADSCNWEARAILAEAKIQQFRSALAKVGHDYGPAAILAIYAESVRCREHSVAADALIAQRDATIAGLREEIAKLAYPPADEATRAQRDAARAPGEGSLGSRDGSAEEPDRSGWPVLVRDNNGDYEHPRTRELAVWTFDGRWWFSRAHTTASTGEYPTALAAADAIKARLPEEASTPDPRDAEIASLRAELDDREARLQAAVVHRDEARAALTTLRGNLAWLVSDGEVTDAKIVVAAVRLDDRVDDWRADAARWDVVRDVATALAAVEGPHVPVDVVRMAVVAMQAAMGAERG